MTQREKLIELLSPLMNPQNAFVPTTAADYLLENGVVIPCRCGECVCWDSNNISCEGFAKCLTGEGGIRYRNQNDFCSRGKRKGGDN